MMHIYRLLAFLLSGFCLVVSSAWGESPSTNSPDVHIGDIWKYRKVDGFTNEVLLEFSHRIVEVNDQEIVIQLQNKNSSARVQRFYTREWNPIDLGGTTFKPYYPEYRFPMAVGQEWKQEYKSSTTDGTFYSSFATIKIVAFEKINVPAGTFDTYRIERSIDARSIDVNSNSTTGRIITWYAPAVKKYVRRDVITFSDGRVRAKDSDELVEFSPQEKSTSKN